MSEQKTAERSDPWLRVRAAEDLQVGWVACKELLEEAIAADLDPQLMRKFRVRVRRLAADVGAFEPGLLKDWGSALTFAVANWVAMEVRQARGERGLEENLVEAFAELDWGGANE